MPRAFIEADYLLETPGDVRRVAEFMAGEQSSGTFVAVPGETPELKARVAARVVGLELLDEADAPALPSARTNMDGKLFRRALVTLAWPLDTLGPSLPNLLATVAGNLFELGPVTGLKLLDIRLPEEFVGPADHSNYSKRAMGLDMVELMQELGQDTFHLVGHDRGGRVAHRLTRDHEARIRTLTVLDISPTLKMFESTNIAFATAYYHWFLMLQPAPLPETLLQGQVPLLLLGRVGRAAADLTGFDKAAIDEYVRCYADPAAIHASCEDYRAAGTVDLEHDRADRGKKIATPLLALWGARAVVGKMFDCLGDWREVASNVSGRAVDCGHFIPEDAPDETLTEVEGFIAQYEAARG